MMRLKRGLCLLLCLVMVLGVVSVMPFTAEAATMTSSSDMLAVLKKVEGFSKKPYWDYGQYTVGYGTACPSDKLAYYQANGITESEAEALLKKSLAGFEKSINNFIAKYNLKVDQGQFDAMVSLSYNCGTGWTSKTNSNLFRAVVSGDKGEDLIYAFTLYSTAGGKYLDGLVRRRLSEANMYINSVYKAANAGGVPANYEWVYLDGNGATLDGGVIGYDMTLGTKVKATFTEIPTGVDAQGNAFAYRLAGWYTADGKKVEVLDGSLTNGTYLYAKWVDPEGNVLGSGSGGSSQTNIPITITGTNVNVRKGPGTNYGKNGIVNKGEKYTVTAIASGSGLLWGKIAEEKWVCLDYTDYKPEESDDDSDSSVTGFPKTGVVNANNVNLRAGAGTGYAKVGQLNKGARVTILEEKRGGSYNWGKLAQSKWICLDYVDYDESSVKKVELVSLPDKLVYESTDDMLRLEGGVLLVTFSNGTCEAMSITSDMVTDFSMTGENEATIVVEYAGFTFHIKVAISETTEKLMIVTQPQSVEAQDGQTVTVSVVATGSGLEYQWYAKTADQSDFVATDAKTATYTVQMTQALDGCKLYCRITDEYGQTADTETVTITLKKTEQEPEDEPEQKPTTVEITVTGTNVNLRKGPGTNYAKAGTAKKGAKYTISDVQTGSGLQWGKIEEEKWIALKYTDYKEPTQEPDEPVDPPVDEPVDPPVQSEYPKNGTVKGTSVSVRKGPGTNYARVAYKKTGDRVTVTEAKTGSGLQWGKIGTDRWICLDYVVFDKPAVTKVELASAPTKTTYETLDDNLDLTGGKLLVTYADGTTETIAITASMLTGAEMTGETEVTVTVTYETFKVTFKVTVLGAKPKIVTQPKSVSVEEGQTATVSVVASGKNLKYLWYAKDAGQSAFTSTGVTTAVYSVQMTAAVNGRQLYCRVTDEYDRYADTDTVTLQLKEKEPEGIQITVTGSGVNLRTGPGTNYAKAGTAKKGDKYTITAVQSGSGYQWGKIAEKKWIALKYTDYKEPTQEPDEPDTPVQSEYPKSGTINGSDVSIRRGAGTNYGRVGFLQKGERVTVSEVKNGSGLEWGKIGDNKWVATKYITFDDTTKTKEAAIKELRKQMIARNSVITVEFLMDEKLTKANSPASSILFAALKHDGTPNGGDYLYRHCRTAKFSGDSVKSGDKYLATLTYTFTYLSDAAQEAEVDKAVTAIIKELNVSGGTEYQKAKAIYDYLCKNVTHDYVGMMNGKTDIYAAYSALINGKAVCQGFASAYYRLALELGLDARLIAGKYENSSHGWNIVKIGDKYYNLDADSDAGRTPDSYTCFLKSDATFSKYTRSADFTTTQFYEDYPMATEDYAQ